MLPYYEITSGGVVTDAATSNSTTLTPLPFRPSVFKARSRVTTTWLLRSHFAEFYPLDRLAAMPSGAKYSRFHIVFQLECLPKFYLSNVHSILFLLVCLAFSTFLIPPTDVSDRMQVVLTLVLTLAAYKVSLTAWLPAKPYLTRMDEYVMWSFAVTSLMGIGAMGAGWLVGGAGDDFPGLFGVLVVHSQSVICIGGY